MFEIANKSTERRLNWYEAEEYVKTLGDGWRLPTKDELNQIYTSDNDFVENGYWSSIEFNTYDAWIQYFYDGNQFTNNKSIYLYVRAVRDVL